MSYSKSINVKKFVSGLEHELINECPVCQSTVRKILYRDLKDYRCVENSYISYCFYLCLNCRSGYYSPRPTKDSIHLLYRDYGTHAAIEGRVDFSSLSLLNKVRRKIANSYTNQRYGTTDKEYYCFGSFLVNVLVKYRRIIDISFRFVPTPSVGGKSTLLDFGCGNGGYLEIATRCGYVAYGIDFDNDAIAGLKSHSHNLYTGDIITARNLKIKFDVITVSHVIEHVFDPILHLRILFDLLKPGGFLYIETPNLDSIGHQYFKGFWRGLEPPRHVQVFNKRSLRELLQFIGFQSVKVPTKFNPIRFICESSNFIESGGSSTGRLKILWDIYVISFVNWFRKDRDEFIYLTARKPL